jgi:hypothetical protein
LPLPTHFESCRRIRLAVLSFCNFFTFLTALAPEGFGEVMPGDHWVEKKGDTYEYEKPEVRIAAEAIRAIEDHTKFVGAPDAMVRE